MSLQFECGMFSFCRWIKVHFFVDKRGRKIDGRHEKHTKLRSKCNSLEGKQKVHPLIHIIQTGYFQSGWYSLNVLQCVDLTFWECFSIWHGRMEFWLWYTRSMCLHYRCQPLIIHALFAHFSNCLLPIKWNVHTYFDNRSMILAWVDDLEWGTEIGGSDSNLEWMA